LLLAAYQPVTIKKNIRHRGVVRCNCITFPLKGAKGDLTARSATIHATPAVRLSSEHAIELTATALDKPGGQAQALGNLILN
jgi:hypothetical protein